MKKTVKKLATVVATAAVCCSMVVPGVAKAATCPPHYLDYEFVREFQGGTYEHEYLYSMGTENGQPVLTYKTCWVDVMVKEYENKCMKCGIVEGIKYEETHIHRVDHPIEDEDE